ncbi:hypothetical protein Sme01_46290 [Sphaerisporangium melleum]|uniref:Uncharacterized protein n=1 Tax=Sphaerisporangium melleum TaxID=321316 RepID=A0A917RD21_9ACTN|nr:hypothetical protein GCM10007964_49700 [Sphaerisporangium melleum]GII72153.1 hypothetical protein Sme01_46290 [Sphaerisporangium melleum]
MPSPETWKSRGLSRTPGAQWRQGPDHLTETFAPSSARMKARSLRRVRANQPEPRPDPSSERQVAGGHLAGRSHSQPLWRAAAAASMRLRVPVFPMAADR